MKYGTVFAGGTFDGRHVGHEAFLLRAFEVGEQVVIGLTSDEFIKKFKRQSSKGKIRSFEERQRALEIWLDGEGVAAQSSICSIDDPFEPASSAPYDALLVTPDNKKNGEEINRRRVTKGLSPVVLVDVSLVPAEDGKPISSTRMRQGEVDRDGKLVMPQYMRSLLSQPLGPILTGLAIEQSIRIYRDRIILTVGDEATKTVLGFGLVPTVAIFDNKTERRPTETRRLFPKRNIYEEKAFVSGPGYISKDISDAINIWGRLSQNQMTFQHTLFIIDGEEDLLALPALVAAPLDSVLYYGQPGEGLVEVIVDEEVKKKVGTLLENFT